MRQRKSQAIISLSHRLICRFSNDNFTLADYINVTFAILYSLLQIVNCGGSQCEAPGSQLRHAMQFIILEFLYFFSLFGLGGNFSSDLDPQQKHFHFATQFLSIPARQPVRVHVCRKWLRRWSSLFPTPFRSFFISWCTMKNNHPKMQVYLLDVFKEWME